MATFLNLTVERSSYGHLGFCAACGSQITGRALLISTKQGKTMAFDEECAHGVSDTIHRTLNENPLPMRFTLSRKAGWRMPPNTVKVDRTTKFGNPIRLGDDDGKGGKIATVKQAVEAFRVYAEERLKREPDWLRPLVGKNVACWCSANSLCHGLVLIELANR